MEQLELRFYTRPEIAQALSVNIKDTDHFAERVKDRLKKWGYGFHYINRQGVEILSKPETPEERLAEILYRGYGIDIQINAEQFACFIAAFTDIEGFAGEPWDKRLKLYNEYYGYSFSDHRTLRSWCSQLIERGVIAKDACSAKWRTYYADGKKIQEPIEDIDEVEMESYFQRRGELFKEKYIAMLERGFPPGAARKAAWKQTYVDLWAEFQCCFYYCKGFNLTSFSYNDVDVRDIYELCRGLAAAAPPTIGASTAPPTTEFVF